jgi:hypothetical protein
MLCIAVSGYGCKSINSSSVQDNKKKITIGQKTHAANNEKPVDYYAEIQKDIERHKKKYPTVSYLTTVGIGGSEKKAITHAVGEISNIFESQVNSNVREYLRSIDTSAGNISYKQVYESIVKIRSSVKIKGLQTIKTWRNKDTGRYYAFVVLEKKNVIDQWLNDLNHIEILMNKENYALNHTKCNIFKITPIKKLFKLWSKKVVIHSRLSVVGHITNYSHDAMHMKKIANWIPTIKSSTLIFIDIKDDIQKIISSNIANVLTQNGYALAMNRLKAEIIIHGYVISRQVNQSNRNWNFAKVVVTLKGVDNCSTKQFFAVQLESKKGHISYDQAVHKALHSVSEKLNHSIKDFFYL